MLCRAAWMEGEIRRANPLPGARYQGASGDLKGSGSGMEEIAAYLGQRSTGG